MMLDSAVRTVVRKIPFPPIEAIFEPTKICNLQCDYCRRNETGSVAHRKDVGNHFTLYDYKQALSKLKHIRTANWIGDGEPLLNPEFNEIIEYTGNKGIKTTFGTNGTLVTRDIVKHWKRNKVSEVSVSIDSPIPEKYENMRVGAKFDRVIESCRMISEAGIKLQLQIVGFAETIPDMPKFVDLCIEVSGWRIALPRPHLYDTLERYRSSYPVPEEANPILKIAHEKMKQAGIRWHNPWYIQTYFKRCMWAFLSLYIQIGGIIQPCCFMSGEDKEDNYDGVKYHIPSDNYIMGNILTDDFEKIWRGDAYKELREILRKTERPIGTEIEPKELHELKSKTSSRFSHCIGCSWRWSVEC